MEDILSLIKSRRSFRSYKTDPVPDELLEKVLEAGRWAPSAVNLQPWHFVVVSEAELRKRVGDHARFWFIKFRHASEAPVLIVLVGDTKSRFYQIDCSLAGENMMLEAASLGLGTCWLGAIEEKPIKAILNIPENLRVVGLITLGYPDEEPVAPPRLELDQIVHRETFGEPAIRKRPLKKAGIFSILKKLWRASFRK